MISVARSRPVIPGGLTELALASLLAGIMALLAPTVSTAALSTFGSRLSVPATLNTAEDLNYQGTNTPLPGEIFHTFHYGADTALWNVSSKRDSATAPAAGQAVKISLEGCAEAAPGGPAPLTQIHFQDLSPLPGGGGRVNLTSQCFNIPVCGQNGASGSTVSSYEPTNLCVSRGDYVAFNDDGGYVENVYRAGVPYKVLGEVRGASAHSFIKNNGTGDGAVMAVTETAANEGFAANQNRELMMRVTLGTGPNARYVCPDGTRDRPPVLPEIRISRQTDGVNRQRIIGVAIYCRPASGCHGLASLTMNGERVSTQEIPFDLPGDTTSHLHVRLAPRLMSRIGRHRGVDATITAVIGHRSFKQTVSVRIL